MDAWFEEDHCADDATIIHPLHASPARRSMRLDALPLLIAQPEKALAHETRSPRE
jgi:hypothetical protein